MIHDLIVDIIVDNLVFRQAYSAKQLDKLEAEFKVNSIEFNLVKGEFNQCHILVNSTNIIYKSRYADILTEKTI